MSSCVINCSNLFYYLIIQARAIIRIARKEMEEKSKTPSSFSEPPSPLLPSQAGVSMKKSLQRFLQKRKSRIQATSPYHH